MTIFEYFLVLFSVILSLALAHLATGFGELVRARRLVKWSLPYILWMIYCASLIIDVWASAWLIRDVANWSLVALLLLLATALSVYLFALWLIPRGIGDGPLDLYDYLVRERRFFMGAAMAYACLGMTWNIALDQNEFDWANYYIGGPLLGGIAIAWWTRNRAIQFVVPVVINVLMVVYLSTYFTRMG